MSSLRGPESPVEIRAGNPALLVFDIVPKPGVDRYEARIVDPAGDEALASSVSVKDGRLSVLVTKLPAGRIGSACMERTIAKPSPSTACASNRVPAPHSGTPSLVVTSLFPAGILSFLG